MNKSNIKVGILLIILFAVIFLLCYIFGDNDRNNRGYVIFNGYDIFEYKHNEWGKVFNVEIQKMKFKVYNNNAYDGEYEVYLSDDFYFFDSNKYSHKFDGFYIAFQDNVNVNLVNYKMVNDFDDSDVINKYLNTKGISYNGEYSYSKKYIVDLNDDKVDDYIYIISNQLYDKNPFYAFFAVVNSKYIDINFVRNDDIKFYDLLWVLSSNNKKIRDIVISSGNGEKNDCYLLRYTKDKYVFLKR